MPTVIATLQNTFLKDIQLLCEVCQITIGKQKEQNGIIKKVS